MRIAIVIGLGVISGLLSTGRAGQPAATEQEFRSAVEITEELARNLHDGLKTYHQHLVASLRSEKAPGLDGLDDAQMGRAAFARQKEGKHLDPDPFADWAEIQKCLDRFEGSIDEARRVAARAEILDAGSSERIPPDVFRKLRNRWRSALHAASSSYQKALAVRAVQFDNGVLIAAQ